MNRIVITSLLSLLCLLGNAQIDMGIKTNLGLSIFSLENGIINRTTKNRPWISGNGGLYLCKHLKKKLNVEADFQINYIGDKDIFEGEIVDAQGNITGETFTEKIKRNITYLSLPVSVGYDLDIIVLNFGLQTSVALFSSAKTVSDDPYYGEVTTKVKNLNIDRLSFGPKIIADIKATEKVSIELAYFYGLNNILKSDVGMGWSWKIHQVTIGVRYNLKTIR